MRIAYIGAERVGLACLQRLLALQKSVAGVVTAADELRGTIADFTPFDQDAAAHKLPLLKTADSCSAETIAWVQALRPELIIVMSWSQRIPEEIIRCAPLGCVGMHYSLLPARRGGAPLNWALIDGLSESGITLFYYDNRLDAGDIIAQRRFPIALEDTAKTLLDTIVALAPEMLVEQLDRLETGTASRTAQDESLATRTKRRRPEDSRIDWSQSKESLYNFIRALSAPYPCAFTMLQDKRLVIERAHLDGDKLRIEGFIE